jgi:hypothetical protein
VRPLASRHLTSRPPRHVIHGTRLDPSEDAGIKELPWAEQREAVLSMVATQNWARLHAMDELQREMLAGRVLCGFKTARCDFAPTFKVRSGGVCVRSGVRLQIGELFVPDPPLSCASRAHASSLKDFHSCACV